MFKSNQLFAFTGPTPAPAGMCAPFFQAFEAPDGQIELRIRSVNGDHAAITLPAREVDRLALEVGAAQPA